MVALPIKLIKNNPSKPNDRRCVNCSLKKRGISGSVFLQKAEELKADLLLIDEQKGREVATKGQDRSFETGHRSSPEFTWVLDFGRIENPDIGVGQRNQESLTSSIFTSIDQKGS